MVEAEKAESQAGQDCPEKFAVTIAEAKRLYFTCG